MVSAEKQLQIERSVAFHLGELKRGFESGILIEDKIENADETHFVFNMDNGKTLGLRGDTSVKYADVTSGGESITMMVRISGGRHAAVQPPFLIFKNAMRSHPVRGVPDDVPGACYRTSPKAWMDGTVWRQWLKEPRAIKTLPDGCQRILYVDNCSLPSSGEDVTDLLQKICTTVQTFPLNATDMIPPADSFVIQKINQAWSKR